jgi:large subunit ribosomal protein L22
MISKSTMRYLRSSPQKTRLFVDQIRGVDVNRALADLGESRKSVARDVSKLLRSAVANAQKGDQRVDADTLYVSRAWVDGGPSLKRIRPATFGRAFRILHRTCHITLELEAKPGAAPRVARAKRRAKTAKTAKQAKQTAKSDEAAAAPEEAPKRARTGRAPATKAAKSKSASRGKGRKG